MPGATSPDVGVTTIPFPQDAFSFFKVGDATATLVTTKPDAEPKAE